MLKNVIGIMIICLGGFASLMAHSIIAFIIVFIIGLMVMCWGDKGCPPEDKSKDSDYDESEHFVYYNLSKRKK